MIKNIKSSHANRDIIGYIGQLILITHFSLLRQQDLIISVPMHLKSHLTRPIKHLEIICDFIGNALHITHDPGILLKRVYTMKQSMLTRDMRLTNLYNSMCVNYNIIKKYQNIKKVAIIDDVFTTGATFNECARAMKEVWPDIVVTCISFARTIMKDAQVRAIINPRQNYAKRDYKEAV